MKKKSNQRITKIKRDVILELLKRAEGTSVENGTTIQTAGSDLTPYPDLNNLRLWTRDYLLKGINKVYPIRLDADGQTYLTTILDGLTMYTKMTKSLTEVENTEWTQPVLSSSGTLGGNEYGVAYSSQAGTAAYMAAYYAFNDFTNSTYCWSPSGYPSWITFYSPNPLNITSVDFKFSAQSWTEIMPECNAYGSNDNSSWTLLGSYNNNSTATITLYLNNTNAYKYYKYEFPRKALNNYGKVKILQHGTILSEVSVETTKPGLWLSNLSQIYSNSSAGGWLRQNLNPTSNSLTDVNSDTLGNYSYSFLQRSIIKRDAGSQHDNNDSFIMHWSPSAKSCIANDAIIIPTNNLRSTYTTYQTMVTPTDVNMQTYEEVVSKNINFNFSDAYQSGETATTAYNGRIVGKDWSYEFIVRPNFSGSGSRYEGQIRCCGDSDTGCENELDCSGDDSVCPECVSDDTRSNGICIEGQFKYEIYEGEECIQTINECFETTQAIWNADNTSRENAQDLNNLVLSNSRKVTIQGSGSSGTTGGTCYGSLSFSQNSITINPGESFKIINVSKNCSSLSGSFSYRLRYWDIDTQSYISQYYDGLSGTVQDIAKDLTAVRLESTSSGCYDEWVACYSGAVLNTTNAYVEIVNTTEVQQPQENINLYLIITDLKAEAISLGLPWNNVCNNTRFTFNITTSDEYNPTYQTRQLLYENVNINNLGDISGLGLNSITLSN